MTMFVYICICCISWYHRRLAVQLYRDYLGSNSLLPLVFSSAVPPDSGAFQMPTRPSAAASTLIKGGGEVNLRNASVTFSLFSLG